MECPYCGSADLKVLDSRPSSGVIRRRRQCATCQRRFTTYEQIASPEIKVQKRGTRPAEDFDRAKLLRVAERVCRGLPVGARDRDTLVRGMEAKLLDAAATQVTSWQLAIELHQRLAELHPVAARRFAADYTDDEGLVRMAPAADRPQLDFAWPTTPVAGPPDKPRPPRARRPSTTTGKPRKK